MESAPHPQQKLLVRLSGQAEIYDILRRKRRAPHNCRKKACMIWTEKE